MSLDLATTGDDVESNPFEQALERYTEQRTGRPSKFDIDTATRIIFELQSGRTMAEISASEWCPSIPAIYRWVADRPAFRAAFHRARTIQAHAFADQALKLPDEALNAIRGDKSDSARVNAYRIKFEALKWRAGVQNAEYRDKQEHRHSGAVGVSLSITGLEQPKPALDGEIVREG